MNKEQQYTGLYGEYAFNGLHSIGDKVTSEDGTTGTIIWSYRKNGGVQRLNLLKGYTLVVDDGSGFPVEVQSAGIIHPAHNCSQCHKPIDALYTHTERGVKQMFCGGCYMAQFD